MNTLGQNIRKRRTDLGMSLRELSRQLGCSAPYVSDLERSNRYPTDVMLREISRLLDFKFKRVVEESAESISMPE